MKRVGERAVVLGASMAGLVAARVLAEAYDEVTVVERDELPSTWANRRGVPQGRHVHAPLESGSQGLERLFPGLVHDLVRGGAPKLNDLSLLYFSVGGHLLCQDPYPAGPVYQASRPYLEGKVRARVRALPNVSLVEGTDVTGLVADPESARVVGARVRGRGTGGTEEILPADLVVDTMGRAARTPAWLEQLGYDRAPEERVNIDVKYASQAVSIRPGALAESLVLVGPVPGRAKGMALFAYESGTWLFTAMGYGDNHPPSDREGMLTFVADCAPAHVMQALRDSESLGEVSTHRFPASQRRHYEKLSRFPEGLLVFGDSICSFNPIYGQGMSVATLGALALRACLERGDRRLAQRFFRAAAKHVDVAWHLAVGSDLTLPEVEGPRPRSVRMVNAYVDRVQSAAVHDSDIAWQFLQVSSLVDPPSALFRPKVVRAVLADRRRRRVDPATAPATRPVFVPRQRSVSGAVAPDDQVAAGG